MARVAPFEGVTKFLRDGLKAQRIRGPAGASGSVTQSLRAQVVVAAAGDQSLGLEADEGLGMGIFIEGGEVGLEGHVGLPFGEVDGLHIAHMS